MDHKSKFLRNTENSMWSFFINNTKIAVLVSVGLLLWGGASALSIPKESAPQIDYGIIMVQTIYDGASAVDIDALVTQELENKIKDVDGVDTINSTSASSSSAITITLKPSTDVSKALNDIRAKVDEAKAKLPEDAEAPSIMELSAGKERPLFTLHLAGDLHPALLRDYAEDLKKYLEQLKEISSISISGGAEREIFIDLDPLALEQFHITVNDVSNALRSIHKDNPIGDLEIDSLNYSLRFKGRLSNAEEVRKSVLSVSNGAAITINDVADVYESVEETQSIESVFDVTTQQRLSTVKLMINKAANNDIFKVDPNIREKVYSYTNEKWGNEVNIYFTNEELVEVSQSYANVIQSGLSSIGIVILILFFFLGVRASLVAALVIPLSFLVTIGVTNAMGGTLNFMVNFSMILALGILVDTAIVVVEGIYEGLAHGYTGREAAIMAVEEFKVPLIAGMLTTLAVFIPLLVLPGIMGVYLSFIPISVSITLLASLLIALFLIPAIASLTLKVKAGTTAERFPKMGELYEKFIGSHLSSRTFRLTAIYGVIVAFLFTTFISIPFSMFPAGDMDMFSLRVKLAKGTVKEEVLQQTLPVEELLYSIPEIKIIETSVGDDEASISVQLLPKKEREAQNMRTSLEIAKELRKEVKQFVNYQVSVQELAGGPPSEAAVGVKIIMDDVALLGVAQEVVEDFKAILKNIPETDNIRDDVDNTPGEIVYTVNREESLRLGVNPNDIANIVRSAIHGVTAIKITRGGREVNVTVRYKESEIQDFNDVQNIQILNNKGDYISLSQVATQELQSAPSKVKRADRNIAIKIGADVTSNGNALEITNAFKEAIKDYELPEGLTMQDIGENAENSELFMALGFGFIMAVFLIFSILVVQFNSFIQPVIIVFTIFMSFLGVNIGMGLTDTPRSLAFIIGAISLSGIVVNDAIILIDRINHLRHQYTDKPLEEVIAFAGKTRLQPIILTTLTTTAGIFPLIFVDTFWAGLAITIIFGLTIASALTLFVTPAMVYQFEKDSVWHSLKPLPFIIGGFVALSMLFGFIGGLFA